MADITPKLVKELRDKTGAGMGDCKTALVESDGDMQKAIEILRKKGAASAAKRADRIANEGLITTRISDDCKKAIIVEINCETDFVARNAEFEKYVEVVARALIDGDVKTNEELKNLKIGSDFVEDVHNEILAKFSEKIQIRRFDCLVSEGYFADYVHAGSKLAVLVELSKPIATEKSRSLARDIAMQIAAMNPQFIDRSSVSKETMDKELEIYTQLAIDQGKSTDIAQKIAVGKLEKFYQEQCLDEQIFVKDSKKTISDVVREIAKESGFERVKILSFRRYFLGESD